MSPRLVSRWLALLLFIAAPSAATTYYVSPSGDNYAPGTSPEQAWRSIDGVNARQFAPGDRILFQGGVTFSGNIYFDVDDVGTATLPIVVGSYGTGRATISAANGNGILAYNTAGFRIQDLFIVGAGRDVNTGSGILFYNDRGGDVLLDFISVERVDTVRFGDYGIEIGAFNRRSGFRNITIRDVIASDNGLGGVFTYAAQRAVHRNVYIGSTTAFQNFGFYGLASNSGNGIVASGVDGGTIEYSVAHTNGSRSDANNGPVGIWTYDSNNVVIQFCESYNNKTGGTKDGGGFHLDNSTSNSVLQYNYSHDNAGAGFMLAHKWNDQVHSGNVIRWNVSQNDARKNNYASIHLWGRIRNAAVHNNTIYLAAGNSAARALHARNNSIESQDLENVRISNNIIQTTGNALVDFTAAVLDNAAGVRLEGNAYWSTGGTFRIFWRGTTYSSLAAFRGATGQERRDGADVGITADPGLRAAGQGPSYNDAAMIRGLWQYRLRPSSQLINAGVDLDANSIAIGSRDFFGGSSSAQGRSDIGAHEYSIDCQWSLSATSASVPLSGGTTTVDVWAPDSSCGWAALPTVTWLRSSSAHSGPGTATITVAASSSARAGTVAIADQTFTVSEGGGSTPPPPPPSGTIGVWSYGDVGATGGSGGSVGDGSTFTITGGGADIWGTTDAFHVLSQRVSGDWEIEARVATVEHVHAWTKAGLMVRETLAPDSKHASIFVTPGKGVSFQYRTTTGGGSAAIAAGVGAAPQWVRLARRGQVITAYRKGADGAWSPVASATVAMGSSVYVGLVVSSHDATRLATAGFDSVAARELTSTVPPPATIGEWTHQDIGAVAIAGSASGSGTSFTVNASGADIWNSADQFRFLYRQLTGDGDIEATVSSVENVNAWTKSGVMIRETLVANAKHASMFVTPGKGLSYQYRATAGGTSAAIAGPAGSAPKRVRVSRRGSTLTAYVHNDATEQWTAVGSVTVSMGASVYAGIVVSSHDNTQLATATFDGVTLTTPSP